MAEVAVCRYYGQDPNDQPRPWWGEPGPAPDLIIHGYTIAVKGTEWWTNSLRLFLPPNDASDVAVLVSVHLATGECWPRGWIKRKDVAQFAPTWDTYRWVRTIPMVSLRPCRAGVHERS
jgi:hypothetical protein